MRLLICTQAVDKNDPILGFFHRWIEEFASRCQTVTVVCLYEGTHTLPANVRVFSLGKNKKPESRFTYSLRFLTNIWKLRNEYDGVFVHMNPEYVVLGGLLWRVLGKRVGLWYVHKSVTAWLRIAVLLANRIFTASIESFRIPTHKLSVTGHGIDTDFFKPDKSIKRGNHILSAGRLDKSKRHDLAILAAKQADVVVRIAGNGPEMESLKKLARDEKVEAEFLGGITQERLRDEYRKAAHFIHTSTTGSLDKVVLEAAACDCNVVTTVDWLHKYFPVHSVDQTPEAIAKSILEHTRESADRVSIIQEKHSLSGLIERILAAYA